MDIVKFLSNGHFQADINFLSGTKEFECDVFVQAWKGILKEAAWV